jgi:hypothetical protein
MTTAAEPRAPFTEVTVQLDAPDSPYGTGTVVNWDSTRFSSGLIDTAVHVHTPQGDCIRLAGSHTLALPEVPAWVPQPPAGWLASLHATAVVTSHIPDPSAFVAAHMTAGHAASFRGAF